MTNHPPPESTLVSPMSWPHAPRRCATVIYVGASSWGRFGGARVLVVEDDVDLARLMSDHLSSQGFAVERTGEAASALERIGAGGVDVVLLDLMLPRLSGDGLLARLRERPDTRDIPVIVVSAKDAVWAKVDLLRLGADDYLTKPFDLDELTARVTALLRRARPAQEVPALRSGALVLDVPAHRVLVGDQELALTPAEFTVLEALMSAERRVVSTVSLVRLLEGAGAASSSLKTHVSRLRAKIRALDPGTDYIETVWGLGYRMSAA